MRLEATTPTPAQISKLESSDTNRGVPMPLTDVACCAAKPDSKPRKLTDSGGLFLLTHPNSAKY